MEKQVTAFAPATVSNVASGFDIMGFALDRPGDSVTVRFSRSPGIRIRVLQGCVTTLPSDPALNTAGAPVLALFKHCKTQLGAEVEIRKGIPVGSGIGSSAASAVAAAVAANELLDAGMSKADLLPFAIEGETIASGSIHVDNLAPSLWGGFVLIRGYHPIDVVRIRVPNSLLCTIIRPHLEIQTKEARKIIPQQIPLADLVVQTGNAAGLIAGLLQEDFGLIGRSLQDVVAEPARSHLIPGFSQMKSAAIAAGALGCSISGSGPSLFALSRSRQTAEAVGEAMGSVLLEKDLPHTVFVSGISREGARIIHEEDHETV